MLANTGLGFPVLFSRFSPPSTTSCQYTVSAISQVILEYFVLIILTGPSRQLSFHSEICKFLSEDKLSLFVQLFTLLLKFASFIPRFDLNPPTAVWVCRLKREFRMPNNE